MKWSHPHADETPRACAKRPAAVDADQASLFDAPRPAATPRPPVAPGSATSAAAARRIAPCAPGMRARVLQFLKGIYPEGRTRFEIEAATGIKYNTVNGRVAELIATGQAIERGEKQGAGVVYATSAR